MTTRQPEQLQRLRFSPMDGPGQAEVPQPQELRSGDLCPQCRRARLDYDCLLNLTCPRCGYAVGGCFT